MLPNMNLSEAKREKIEAGGYVVKVLGVSIDEKYNRLQLQVDIEEGPHKGYYSRLNTQYGFWGLTANLYLNKESAWKFADAIEAFRSSNEGFSWNDDGENDEQTLVGKTVGVVTRRRHYLGNDGKEKSSLQVYKLLPAEDVRIGNFKIPEDVYADELKNRQPASAGVVDMSGPVTGFGQVQDDDVPF